MTFSSSTTNSLQNPGQNSVLPPNQIRSNRAPSSTDINANIGDEWQDYSVSPPNFYKLASLYYNQATWRLITGGSGGSITITGDSGGGLTGTSFTFTGGTTGLTFAGSGTTETLGGIVTLAHGGTNANLTASNGGIFYSTATAGAILSGTATASQVLLSGSTTAPSWSTATYPSTTTVSQLLYSSSANTVSGLATANDGVLITSNTGVPSWLANSGTAGFVLTANTGAPPSWQAATSSSNLTVTSVAFGASPYTVLTTDQFLACQTSGGAITIRLPNAPTTGRVIIVKDSNGAASTNNISVTTVGGTVTIDGQTTYKIAGNYGSISVVFDGTNYEVF